MEENHQGTWNRKKTQHGIPPANGRTNRMNQLHIGTIPQSIHQLSTRGLVWLPTTSRICIQQRISGNNQGHTSLRKLRNQPRVRDDRSSDPRKENEAIRNDSAT